MKARSLLSLAAGMMLAASQMAIPAAAAAKATVHRMAVARDEKRARRLDFAPEIGRHRYRKRNGWSVAQDRRNARHARNVRRNRAAHR